MTAYPETFADCLQLLEAIRHRLDNAGHEKRHCVRSCACNICYTARLLLVPIANLRAHEKNYPGE